MIKTVAKHLKLIAILSVAVLATGCSTSPESQPQQTKESENDTIIRETKKCEDAGLKAEVIRNGLTNGFRKIQCVPKEDG